MTTNENQDKKISEEDQELMDKLDLPIHVQHALIKILLSEKNFKTSNICSIKDIVNKACQDRTVVYYKYHI